MMVGPKHGAECVNTCEEGILNENGNTVASIPNAVYVNDMTYKYVMRYTLCTSSCPSGMYEHETTHKCLDTCTKFVSYAGGAVTYCADPDTDDVGFETFIYDGDGGSDSTPDGYRFYSNEGGVTTYYDQCPKLRIENSYQCVSTCPEDHPIEFEGQTCLERCNSLEY